MADIAGLAQESELLARCLDGSDAKAWEQFVRDIISLTIVIFADSLGSEKSFIIHLL